MFTLYKMKTYEGRINSLEDNQVFVFGSNLAGFHGGGSAGFASFGIPGNVWRGESYDSKPNGWKGKWNIKGIGVGFQKGHEGMSYAIPTVTRAGLKNSITLGEIKESVKDMYEFAHLRSDLEFLVAYTDDNMNLNGYTSTQMASCFSGKIPFNIVFESGFLDLIKTFVDFYPVIAPPIVKEFGVDFDSYGNALTLGRGEVTEGDDQHGLHSRTHEDGWTVKGEIKEDYYIWVNEFEANHPEYGKVWGDFESVVRADSEEGFQHFYENHQPTEWDYGDI